MDDPLRKFRKADDPSLFDVPNDCLKKKSDIKILSNHEIFPMPAAAPPLSSYGPIYISTTF